MFSDPYVLSSKIYTLCNASIEPNYYLMELISCIYCFDPFTFNVFYYDYESIKELVLPFYSEITIVVNYY